MTTTVALLFACPGALPAQEKVRAPAQAVSEIKAGYERLGNLEKEHQKIIQLLRRQLPEKGARHAQERLTRIRQEIREEQQKVQDLIEQAKRDHPAEPQVCSYYADLMISRGHRRQALENLAITIKARPRDLQAGARHARLLFYEGRFKQALAAVRRLRRAREEKHLLPILTIGILGDLGRWQEAEREAAQAIGFLEHKRAQAGKTPLSGNKQIDATLEQLRIHRDISRQYARFQEREEELRQAESSRQVNPRVRLETSRGTIVLELFEEAAPNTVANFIELARKGFYQGTSFHREVPGFIVQGGDPNTRDSDPSNDGRGGPGYYIVDECNHPRARKHFVGSLSMANESKPDTNGSQFFITKHVAHHLNGKHTVFGRVVKGMASLFRLRRGDKLLRAEVLRMREHEYESLKLKR